VARLESTLVQTAQFQSIEIAPIPSCEDCKYTLIFYKNHFSTDENRFPNKPVVIGGIETIFSSLLNKLLGKSGGLPNKPKIGLVCTTVTYFTSSASFSIAYSTASSCIFFSADKMIAYFCCSLSYSCSSSSYNFRFSSNSFIFSR
jgi:hypothetical protein